MLGVMYGNQWVLRIAIAIAFAGCVTEAGDEEGSVEQEVLGPPSNVTVTGTSPDRATVSWDAVSGAVKYYIYQGTSADGPFTFLNTVRAPGTQLAVAHLTPGAMYCFVVRTEDGTGPGGNSTPGCTTTGTGPQPPLSVVATQTSTTSIRVDWAPVSGATKYYIYRAGALAGTYSYLTTVTSPGTSLANVNLTEATTYCYKVAAVDANGWASPMSTGHCNTSLQPPTGVMATRVNTTRIRVDWTQATNTVKYYIYRSANDAAPVYVTSVVQGAAPTFTNINLTTGVQYCYYLKSVNSFNQTSPYSLPAACATP